MMVDKVKLGSVAKILNGYAFKSEEYIDDGIRIVRITNVQKGQIKDDDPKFIDITRRDEFSDYMLANGDVLISLTGNVGRVGIIYESMLPAALNQRVGALKIKSANIEPRYLFHLLNSKTFERDAIKNSRGVAQLNLSSKWIENYQIPLPPLAEQKRIVAILDAADALRANRRETLAQLDTLLQSTFLDMFGDPVTNPKGWESTTLGTLISDVKNGLTRRRKISENTGQVVLRLKDIRGGYIEYSDLNKIPLDEAEKSKFQVAEGDFLFIRVNGNPDYVGRCSPFYGYKEPVYFNDHIMRIRFKLDQILPNTLSFLLNSDYGRQQISLHRKTSAGQHTINQGGLSKIKTFIPPLDLQRRFATIVESVEQQKSRLRTHLAELDTLFASLQSRAFNGEL